MKINCIVIDDEPLARKGMINFINEISFLNPVAAYSNPVEALEVVSTQDIKLIFLDIQMPKMTGLEFLKTLPDPPVTIITSAFPNHALESFELNVMDYLIKPIPFERFVKAVNKAKDFFELKEKAGSEKKAADNYFFIKCENRYEKIVLDELLYVEALQNYVVLYTINKRLISYLTFKSIEEYLPENRFLKVQRSYIVSLSHIDSIEGNEIKIGNKNISISRANKDEILNIILKNKLLRKQEL
jgi:DNA-binding LytR/AlgR family response regulator